MSWVGSFCDVAGRKSLDLKEEHPAQLPAPDINLQWKNPLTVVFLPISQSKTTILHNVLSRI